jgi:hypothetical protein
MNRSPLRTAGCTQSRPCSKCREASIARAHVVIRYDSRGTRRGLGQAPAYQSRRGGYWRSREA